MSSTSETPSLEVKKQNTIKVSFDTQEQAVKILSAKVLEPSQPSIVTQETITEEQQKEISERVKRRLLSTGKVGVIKESDYPVLNINLNLLALPFHQDPRSSLYCQNKVFVPAKLHYRYSEEKAEAEHKSFGTINADFEHKCLYSTCFLWVGHNVTSVIVHNPSDYQVDQTKESVIDFTMWLNLAKIYTD